MFRRQWQDELRRRTSSQQLEHEQKEAEVPVSTLRVYANCIAALCWCWTL